MLEDEFIDQRLCLAFKDSRLARATLEWCGRDLDRHPELLATMWRTPARCSWWTTARTRSSTATAG